MNLKKLFLPVLLLAVWTACADDDVDLRINGKFRGTAANAMTAPGWSADKNAGSCRVLPVPGKNEFLQEIKTAGDSKTIFSDFLPVSGEFVKVELEYYGTGLAAVSCFCYDQRKQLIGKPAQQALSLTERKQKSKNRFPLPQGTAWIRIGLTAGSHSQVCFGDVEAELPVKGAPVVATPQLTVSTPPPETPSAGKPTPRTAVEQGQVSPAIPTTAVMLRDDQKIYYREIATNAVYQGTTTVGHDFEFKLGEDSSKNLFWQVVSYDSTKCRVKVEHDHNGVGTLNFDDAEIEVKSYSKGVFQFEFKCGDKKVTFYLTVL